MKQKTNPQPVTKKDLKKEIQSLEKRLTKRFATKDDLSTLEFRIDLKLDNLKREIDNNAQKYRDAILTSNDKIVKELETIRQEQTVGGQHFSDLQEEVEKHAKRISKLEKSQVTV